MSERMKIITKDVAIPIASVVAIAIFAYNLGMFSQRVNVLEEKIQKTATVESVENLKTSVDQLSTRIDKYVIKSN